MIMKSIRKVTMVIVSVIAIFSIMGWAQQIRVLRIYSGGEMIQQHKISDIDYVEIQDIDEEIGFINGYEYVDLGLPSGIKWATCNIGASSPEEYGNYYSWGETTTKTVYNGNNCTTSGKILGDISGNEEYDVARTQLGGEWRLPTDTEMIELLDECIWTWTTLNGKEGYLVTGPNKNQIFLPAAGYMASDLLRYDTNIGRYWSSSYKDLSSSYFLSLSKDEYVMEDIERYIGASVRAVYGTKLPENYLRYSLRGEPVGGPGGPSGFDNQLVLNGWQMWDCPFEYNESESLYSWDDRFWESNVGLSAGEIETLKAQYSPVNITEEWPSLVRLEKYPAAMDEDGKPYEKIGVTIRWDNFELSKRWYVYPIKNLEKGLYKFSCKVGELGNRSDDRTLENNHYVKINGLRVTMQKKVGPEFLSYDLNPEVSDAAKQAGVPVKFQSSIIQIEDGGNESPVMHKWSAQLGNPTDGDVYICFQGSSTWFFMGEMSLVRIGDYPE